MGENSKKYHVTDEGDVYRINDDGSFTSMGNAEKMSNSIQTEEAVQPSPELSFQDEPIKPYIKRKRRGLVIGGIILLFLLGGISLFYLFNNPQISNIAKEEIISADTVNTTIIDESLTEIVQPIAPDQLENPNKTDKLEASEVEPDQPPISQKEEYYKNLENFVESPNRNVSKVNSSNVIDPDKIYSAVEVQADFPGGDRARIQWLRDNIQWPRDANGQQLHGDVELDFVIECDGSISNVKVTYSENTDLNTAAIRLISSMPKWSPAMIDNQPVRSPMGITLGNYIQVYTELFFGM